MSTCVPCYYKPNAQGDKFRINVLYLLATVTVINVFTQNIIDSDHTSNE